MGICGVLGVWENIRMKVSRGSLLLYEGKSYVSVYCKGRGGMLGIGVSCGC